MFLQGTGEGAVRTFFNVYLDSTYRVPTEVLGVLAASGNLLGAVAALLMPAISRRIGHKSLFVFGTLGISASLALLFFLPGVLAASLGFILVIVLVSVTRPAVLVYLMRSAAEKVRTLLSGVYTMAMGLSWSAVALLGALVLSSLGYPVFFLLCAGFVAISAMTFAAQRSEQYD
jgi:predicted MFS family arabinose efflux permease